MMGTTTLRPRTVYYTDDDGARLVHVITATIRPQEGPRLTIRHEPTGPDTLALSLTGELWPATPAWSRDRRYREAFSYGQNLESLRAAIIYDRIVPRPDGLTAAEAGTVARLWDRWHLNGMIGLCAHQSRAGWRCTRTGTYAYTMARDPWTCAECARSRWDCEAPCFEAPGTHPYAPVPLIGPLPIRRRDAALPCGVCGEVRRKASVHGYRAGTAWLVEPLPVGVLEDVARIFGGGLADRTAPKPRLPGEAMPRTAWDEIL